MKNLELTERRVAALFILLLFAVVCVMQLSASGIRTKKTGSNLPAAGNPDEIEFSIDETFDLETGILISGKCFRPNRAKTYYNFGDDFVFEGVYAEIAFVIFHDGEAVEIPTHAMLLSDMEEEEIYGVSEYNAFLPKEYEEDLAKGDAALLWRSADKEEIFYLKDQKERTGDEETDEE